MHCQVEWGDKTEWFFAIKKMLFWIDSRLHFDVMGRARLSCWWSESSLNGPEADFDQRYFIFNISIFYENVLKSQINVSISFQLLTLKLCYHYQRLNCAISQHTQTTIS